MTALSKLKYFIATIVFLVICVLLTAFQASIDTNVPGLTIVLNFTYAALFVCAFLFGGIVTGVSSILGICLYILLKNQSAWLALLGLVVGLVFGIITKLTTYLIDKKKIDQRALLISSGAFFIAIGIIFTAIKVIYPNDYYILKNTSTFIRFHWIQFVLPYIIGVAFILAAIFLNKMKENIKQMFIISGFVSTSAIVVYGITCVLCSIKKSLTFSMILARAYNTYFQSFLVSISLGLIIAMVIYSIGTVILEVRRTIKNMVKDAE